VSYRRGKSHVSQRISRVFPDRLGEIIDCPSQILVGFPWGEFCLDLVDDRPRYFTLEREDTLDTSAMLSSISVGARDVEQCRA
jgi:hypothetical protein